VSADPTPDPVAEHPFTRALRTWEARPSADTWQQVVTDARQQSRGWHEIGQALGVDPEQARHAYLAAVEQRQLRRTCHAGAGTPAAL